ncbi:MAG: HD-GYP domain-containing protein [Lachnospira sp.]|nr:HD-GYP domain-containing protein [Lachnospira sp.]
MKIDQSIIDGTGRILLAKGTPLDEYYIDALKKMNIMGVYIREGVDDPNVHIMDEKPYFNEPIPVETAKKIEELTVRDRAKLKITQSVKKRVAEGVSYLYSNTDSPDFLNATHTVTEDLMKAIDDNDALAFDIGMLKVSDEYTFKHSVDVATISMIVAKKMGMSKREVYDVGVTGLLHDIGKSKIPNEVLNKPGKLDDKEFSIMKQHTILGYKLLEKNKGVNDKIRMGVLQHHEKINGRGYPSCLFEHEIGEYAKILSVADIYDALVTERPYKAAFTQRDAVEMIMAMTHELDINVMKNFLKSVILYPVNSIVQLSNGEYAKVVQNYENYILRPKVVGLKTGKVYDLAYDLSCANIIIP